MSKSDLVEALLRGLDLLNHLNRQRVASTDQLHRLTGLPKATVVRLMKTLCHAGYVMNDRRQGGYQVTSLVQSLGAGFYRDPLVVEAARPIALAYTRTHAWPVSIAVPDENGVIIRYTTGPDSPVSPFHGSINMQLSYFHHALGRAYIAFAAPEFRRLQIELEEARVPGSQARINRMIKEVVRNGYAERDPMIEPRNSNTIAAPILRNNHAIAAIGITFYKSASLNKNTNIANIKFVMEMSKSISEKIN